MNKKITVYMKSSPDAKAHSGELLDFFARDFFGDEVKIEKTPQGKPFFKDKEGYSLSLSHSGELYILAIGEGEVGIDAEELRHAFPERIKKRLGAEGLSSRESFDLWVRKEAEGKLVGRGVFERIEKPALDTTRFFDISREASDFMKKPYSAVIAADFDADIIFKDMD